MTVLTADTRTSHTATIIELLTMIAGQHPTRPDWQHNSIAGLILRHGRAFPGAALPADIPPGPLGQCFANAGELALNNRRYLYCEGWASACGIPLEHAWCIDTHTGTVADPTWPDPETATYVGVTVPLGELANSLIRSRHWGLLTNDWRTGHHHLRHGITAITSVGHPLS